MMNKSYWFSRKRTKVCFFPNMATGRSVIRKVDEEADLNNIANSVFIKV